MSLVVTKTKTITINSTNIANWSNLGLVGAKIRAFKHTVCKINVIGGYGASECTFNFRQLPDSELVLEFPALASCRERQRASVFRRGRALCYEAVASW